MSRKKGAITQKKAVFYLLWKAHKEEPEKYLPAWHFIGEYYMKELNEWFFLSYKGPANGIAIFFENPGLIERRQTVGKTGAKYYEYRMNLHPTFEMIKDADLRGFAGRLERAYVPPRV